MRPVRTTLATAALVVLSGCATTDGQGPVDAAGSVAQVTAETAVERPTVTVHKTASCECCGQYEAYLTAHGVEVEAVVHDDVGPLKDELGVPTDQRSCHTNEVGGYFAEGHVPVEAIDALLDQAPDVDGIALAGMPAGSPGMPGEKTDPFVVTTVVDGEVVGELGEF